MKHSKCETKKSEKSNEDNEYKIFLKVLQKAEKVAKGHEKLLKAIGEL
ncbi:TPA: hypothetical protein HA235_00760 [Candidatus Woesearchaeota archaeon]|nr:hypothetical protein [Candidatus Woesearchaeota archaeon]HIH31215.1 hypothetical protein [Candidatus Woesearchaeota archaeon]HIH55519.1 hypothetical protein [Candidatus Woesearchaeota archaeon]HIJ02210.1 hypothetical protein [Candidatus Woesearchaeota archaeon]HIJ13154.1 hypothetical protein [Candidatus Woesearchaeota archaeon]